MAKKINNIIEHLMKYTDIPLAYESDCWMWTGTKNKKGYGYFNRSQGRVSKTLRANRAMYEHYFGEIPKDRVVCHSCDIPSCVNPRHLWLGTNLDNARDSIRKKRASWQKPNKTKRTWNEKTRQIMSGRFKGEKNPRAILTEEKVLQMREDWTRGEHNVIYLGNKYGCRPFSVYDVVSRRVWKHI